jgi:transcription initiation factor TFIIIB Brf1 subunit/transcription initiation factor TFIIB
MNYFPDLRNKVIINKNHILDNQKIIYCSNCGENKLIFDSEYNSFICGKCGTSNGTVLSNCPELRDQKYEKTGTSDTIKSIRGRPEYANKLYLSTRNNILGKLHNKTNYGYNDQALRKFHEKINRLFKNVVDKTILNETFELYCSIRKNSTEIFRGNGFVGACLFYITSKLRKPIDISNVSLILKCTEKCIMKYHYRLLNHIHKIGDEKSDILAPIDFAEVCMEKLGIDEKNKEHVRFILKKIEDNDIIIKNNAKTIAVGAINLISSLFPVNKSKSDPENKCTNKKNDRLSDLENEEGETDKKIEKNNKKNYSEKNVSDPDKLQKKDTEYLNFNIDIKDISNVSELSEVTVYKSTINLKEKMDELGINIIEI